MGIVSFLRNLFRDPLMEEVAARLRLTWVACPVPMYSNDAG